MTGGAADAEDVAQEAFVKLWKNPSQVREGGALKGWLMRVASNAVIDGSRKPRPAPLDGFARTAGPAGEARRAAGPRPGGEEVDASIAALPDRQRQALSLVYFEGLSNIEAAAVMEVSVDAIESLLARARRSLKESLSAEWRDLIGGLAQTGR